MDKRIGTAVAIVVITLWSVSFIASMVRPQYEPHPIIHTLMLMVAGAALGIPLIKKNGNGNGNGHGSNGNGNGNGSNR